MDKNMAENLKKIDRKTPPDWIIHMVGNNMSCACCGKVSNPYLPHICDAHTHGMDRYGQTEFQVILNSGLEIGGYILNEFGFRVRAGERFQSGDFVEGILTDCPVRLVEMGDTAGDPVLRVIIPDRAYRWPEDERCESPYILQKLPLAALQNLEDQFMQ